MKKNLPLILIGGGVLIIVLAIFVVIKSFKSGSTAGTETEEEVVLDLPESQWPILTLTPTTDVAIPNSLGHLLKLQVQKINVPGAKTMDYLLVYNTSSGGQQGVPGTIQLSGADINKDLLLGSESSGKFRFDVGVNKGSITITFRNSNGKSMGKLVSDFTFDSPKKGVYSVTMNTFANGTQTLTSEK